MSNVRTMLPRARAMGIDRWQEWKWVYRAGISPAGIIIMLALLAREAAEAQTRFSRQEPNL